MVLPNFMIRALLARPCQFYREDTCMDTGKAFFATLGLLGALTIGLSEAAPPEQYQEYPERQQREGKGPQHNQSRQQGAKSSSHEQKRQAPAKSTQHKQSPQGASKSVHNGHAQQHGGAQSWGSPPRDFASVHQAFHQRRNQIGRGPSLPAGIRVIQGRPLPVGYGKRLDPQVLRGLPQYRGYEWRRVGSDIVLIAVTTGIVYTILSGVLN
jgi:Ni/Co efflux regulator RcnB